MKTFEKSKKFSKPSTFCFLLLVGINTQNRQTFVVGFFCDFVFKVLVIFFFFEQK